MVISMSCTSATIAAIAKANSKRMLMKATMIRSAATTAWSAWLRTCSPNVGLTLFTLTSAPRASPKDSWTRVCSCWLRTGVRTSYPSSAVCTIASRRTSSGNTSLTSPTLSWRSGLATVNLTPPSKSMPKFRLPRAIAVTPARRSTPDMANHSFQPPTKSTFENTALAHLRRLLCDAPLRDAHQLCREVEAAPRDHAEERPGDHDGREHAQNHAYAEQDREPPHRAAGEREEDKGGYHGGDVAVQDSPEALLVSGPDGGTRRLAAPDLLLDPLEDHDVRVRGDAYREHDPRDAGERHGDRHRDDDPPQEERVDQERQVRDHPERPVDGHEEQEYEPEAHERREEPALERVCPERGTYGGDGEHLHVHRQGAGLQHDLQLLCLLLG